MFAMFQSMREPSLSERAQMIVDRTRKTLPPELRAQATRVPVVIHDFPGDDLLGEDLEPDIMGLFVGTPYSSDPSSGTLPAQIFLFVENIIDEAEGDLLRFDDEVRITYLHELGHYLGLDEEDLEARGLE